MLRSGYRPILKRYYKIRTRCWREGIGLAIITSTLLVLIMIGGTVHFVTEAKPVKTAQPSEETYQAWASRTAADLNAVASSKPTTAADCTQALPALWKLQSDPLPPVDPADWSAFIKDSEAALSACASGDTERMLLETGQITGDTDRWTAAVHKQFPDTGTP